MLCGSIYQYGQDGLLLEETNGSGVAQADYIYLDGRPIATLNNATGTLYFLHDDMLGTPQLATDASQTVEWQAIYQPFGMASASGTITQNLRLPGQYLDVESGWNHNGFRNYIPDLGRYAEPDPLASQGSARSYLSRPNLLLNEIGQVDGLNPYSYTDSNPIGYIDPLGLVSYEYHLYETDTGWGFLNGGHTSAGPQSFDIDCQCQAGGGFKGNVTIKFAAYITYGTKGELEHELGHVDIMRRYFNQRESYYADKYERTYPSYGACKAAKWGLPGDLAKDFNKLNSDFQHEHDDPLQKLIEGFYSLFKR